MPMDNSIREELISHVRILADTALQGRVPLSHGSQVARQHVLKAFTAAGLDPVEHDIQVGNKKHGTNVIAELPAMKENHDDHFILIGAHYDHLHHSPGADDNAAAVAEMLVMARRLSAGGQLPKKIVFAAFDCEEPPHFHGPSMGSTHYLEHHVTNMDFLDLAVILDLTGHAPRVPGLERHVFVTGTEGSKTLHGLVSAHRNGLEPACIHNDHVGDMSDHHAFRLAGLPYLFLSAGFWEHYHAKSDAIENLDIDYMVRIVQWLEGLVHAACTTPPAAFKHDPYDRDSFAGQEAKLLFSLTGMHVSPGAVRDIIARLKSGMM